MIKTKCNEVLITIIKLLLLLLQLMQTFKNILCIFYNIL